MVWIPAFAEIGLGALAFGPFLLHRWSVGRWRKTPLAYPQPDKKTEPCPVTVLLPVWNEALVIETKLANLASQEGVSFTLLAIDSASTDDTVRRIKRWLEKHPNAFANHELIEMEHRLGKSKAVQIALESLESNGFDGLVCMTDADASMPPNALKRLHGWFANPTVGAVGASARRSGGLGQEQVHRSMFELLREGESAYDSTPFLEGSLMMWRSRSFNASQMNIGSNADDAQIATQVRLNGLRSIHDPMMHFADVAPTTPEGQRRQKVRRAQGLQRLLLRHRKHWRSPRIGNFSKILRREAHFHLAAPLLLVGAATASVLRWGTVLLWGMPIGTLAMLHGSLAMCELLALTSWALHRNGMHIPGLATVGSIFTGMEHLLAAMWTSFRGRSLHMWDQHTDTRVLASKQKK
ncbi:glycosyltransferase [Candidatus Poseidoniaceae archaeon]|nr:glycosyltransferase [Candidatus Poseidoniaceae archaeon]